MEPTMEEKLKAVIELCEAGDPEMCAFLGKEFYYGMNVPQDMHRDKPQMTGEDDEYYKHQNCFL